MGSSSILICIILIGICSFIPFAFDPSNINSQFWINETLIIAITIFSLVSAMFIGQAGNAQNEKSNIAKARTSFFEKIKEIVNLNAFCQWIKESYAAKRYTSH